jgi:hypothetical protein
VTDVGIVIPAYAGAAVIHRSLRSLVRQDFAGRMHVVVAVNDDRRDTLATAAALAPGVAPRGSCSVISTPRGRRAAIAAAERLLPAGPRIYLDQDAALSSNAVRLLTARLAPSTGCHFAAPRLRVHTTSPVSRAYYRAWTQLPYVRHSPATVGAYAVSEVGRRRWDELPSLHSDDKFVRLRFARHERAVITDATYEVVAPHGLRELVHARRRYRHGNRELIRRLGSALPAHDLPRHSGVLSTVLGRPRDWPSFAVLAAVHTLSAASVPDRRRNAPA